MDGSITIKENNSTGALFSFNIALPIAPVRLFPSTSLKLASQKWRSLVEWSKILSFHSGSFRRARHSSPARVYGWKGSASVSEETGEGTKVGAHSAGGDVVGKEGGALGIGMREAKAGAVLERGNVALLVMEDGEQRRVVERQLHRKAVPSVVHVPSCEEIAPMRAELVHRAHEGHKCFVIVDSSVLPDAEDLSALQQKMEMMIQDFCQIEDARNRGNTSSAISLHVPHPILFALIVPPWMPMMEHHPKATSLCSFVILQKPLVPTKLSILTSQEMAVMKRSKSQPKSHLRGVRISTVSTLAGGAPSTEALITIKRKPRVTRKD